MKLQKSTALTSITDILFPFNIGIICQITHVVWVLWTSGLRQLLLKPFCLQCQIHHFLPNLWLTFFYSWPSCSIFRNNDLFLSVTTFKMPMTLYSFLSDSLNDFHLKMNFSLREQFHHSLQTAL